MNVIKEIKIWMILNSTLSKMEKLFAMKLSTNVILQFIGLAIQGGNQVATFIPDKDKIYVTAGVSILQGIVAIISHFSNPNGTPTPASGSIPVVKS